MRELSRRQRDILDFINQTLIKHGYPPTLREICKKFSIASTNGARYHLHKLREMGYLSVEPHKSRGMRLVSDPSYPDQARHGFKLPILGHVPAGPFNYASPDYREDEMTIDPSFFKSRVDDPRLFGLRVTGDSMVNAGILDRDVVVVRAQETANNGEIVVARLDDEATVKRFRREGTKVMLYPENPAYTPIEVSSQGAEFGQSFSILGLVVGLIRSM